MTLRSSLLTLACVLALPLTLQAQATRTWVSGVGDDANPCSRTAPGKTFAGAISKTAAGGMICALDPGGFGTLTITKAIQIDGTGTLAGVMAGGSNGIVVSAGAADVVVLRNLDIQGLGMSPAGVSFVSGKSLILDHCRIANFTTGVSVAPGNDASVTLVDCTILNSSGDGVNVAPSGASTANVNMTRTVIQGCGGLGVSAHGGGRVTLNGCTVTGNATGLGTLESNGRIAANDTDVSFNQVGLQLTAGSMHISRCMILGNTTNIKKVHGVLYSFQNNTVPGSPWLFGFGAVRQSLQ